MFYLILIKFGFNKEIFKRVINTKFEGNPSSGTAADTRGQTDGNDESNRRSATL